MDEAFYSLVESGEEIRSISDAHRFLEKLSAHYAVDNLAYLGVNVPRPHENRPVFVISTYAKEWVERYRARNYQRIDPVLPESMKGILPLDWRNLPLPNSCSPPSSTVRITGGNVSKIYINRLLTSANMR
jgi:hypothetical protein